MTLDAGLLWPPEPNYCAELVTPAAHTGAVTLTPRRGHRTDILAAAAGAALGLLAAAWMFGWRP